MWLSIQLSPGKTIYIALCYFPPKGSRFARTQEHTTTNTPDTYSTHLGDSPFTDLSKGIIEYSSCGAVFLIGDFNARTQDH